VALLAVCSATLPIIFDFFTPKQSDVQCSLFEWEGKKVKLVVSNRGVRPAVVRGLHLVPNNEPPLSFRPDVKEQILELGKYQILTLTNVVDNSD
jgi:hypothetical protein